MDASPSTKSGSAKRKRGSSPQPLHAAQFPDALLTLKTASAISGLSEATLYRKAANDGLKMVRIGQRCTRIRAGDLTAWMAAKAAA